MESTALGYKASKMHKSYFDKAKQAQDQGFFLEAVFLEYSAIEGRLEVICGLLGCPCNKELEAQLRKNIQISHRIQCLKKIYKRHPACDMSKAKLSRTEWDKLQAWIKERNTYVHGLFKRPKEYTERIDHLQKMACEGYRITDILYKEAKRLRYLSKHHIEMMAFEEPRCRSGKCQLGVTIPKDTTNV